MSYVLSTVMVQPVNRPPYGRLTGLRGVAEDAVAFVAKPFELNPALAGPDVSGAHQVMMTDATGRAWFMVMPADKISYAKPCLESANALAVKAAAEGIKLSHKAIAQVAMACQAERRGEKGVGFTQAVIDLVAVKTEAWYRDPMYLAVAAAAGGFAFWRWKKKRARR